MYFKERLYEKNIEGSIDEILLAFADGISFPELYFLCVFNEKNGNNKSRLMEIIHTLEFFKPLYINKSYTVIGLAYGKYNAFRLAAEVVQDFTDTKRDFMHFKHWILEEHK